MIDKNKEQGLGAAAAILQPRLEERIRQALLAVPKDEDLVGRHPNAANRTNVRKRLLLKAVLDVVFDEFFDSQSVVTMQGVEVTIPDVADPWAKASSDFCAARRDFIHDADRLNSGAKAELVCVPVKEEASGGGTQISAERKLLLRTLFVLENRGANCKEAVRLRDLAEVTKIPAGTIRTSMRQLRASLKLHGSGKTDKSIRFSKVECDFYEEMKTTATKLIGSNAPREILGNLYMPTLAVFSKDQK